jgi:predicted nucleic acid-binding protein
VKSAYLDASALVKLALPEEEGPALHDYLDDFGAIFTSEISEIEVRRAVRRTSNEPKRLDAALRWLDVATAVGLDAELRETAATVAPHDLPTLDAIQLASALTVRDLLHVFVTYDRRLVAAARDAGFDVRSPGRDA